MTTSLHQTKPVQPRGLYIAGQWRTASDGRTFTVQDPATGEDIAEVADGSVDDGIEALDAAVAAQSLWATTPPRKRSEIITRAWEILNDRAEEFAALISSELGKPLAESRGEVTYGGEFLRWFAEEAVRISGRYGIAPDGNGRIIVSQQPVGPCYFITPWNFPLAMATRKIAPALAAGCTVVIKPAALTPLTTLALVDVFAEAGLPDGVLNVVTTKRTRDLSAAIIADPRLRKLSFTGSTEVGIGLLKQAADNVLRTSMELGGNAPFIIFDDADLPTAVDAAMAAKFRNIGQACTAANRFYVHEGIVESFIAEISERVRALKVGPATEPGAQIGPLIDVDALTKVDTIVQDAINRGATLKVGGHRLAGPGTFYAPTVLSAVPEDSEALTEEIFGPVLAISTFASEDEAIDKANNTPFGLASYVFTRDLARTQRLVDRLETGMMGVNVGVVSNPAAPFGGVKHSGLGREGGFEGIHEFLEPKYVLTADPSR